MIKLNTLLIYFALPIAVIIFSIVLQKVSRCPIIVASIIFAIFLVVAFLVDVANFLVATIAYTIVSFITAYLTMLICRILNTLENNNNGCNHNCNNNCNNNCCSRINNTAVNNNETQLTSGTIQIGTNGTSCTCNESNTISVVANVTPNSNNNGRTGRFSGCYRR